MKLYKTSYFKDIKEIEVISFNDHEFEALGINYVPESSYFKTNPNIIVKIDRYNSQNNYHETLDCAKKFVLKRLNELIKKSESDLKRYNNLLKKFE